MQKKFKQAGQGMTEYIIIVALIAVAAIGVYGFFGDAIRGQVSAMTTELSGGDGGAEKLATGAAVKGADDEAKKHKTLSTYTGNNTSGGE